MKRFLAKVGRFFWSRGFLIFCLAVVALVVLFYVEEDWRGAHAWAATKAKWEAKGESFDLRKFIPPPIPDDQNLAALPLFKLEYDSSPDPFPYPRALQKAVGTGFDHLPMGNWMHGDPPDIREILLQIASDYRTTFRSVPASKDALEQFDALYPFVAQLHAAAAERPQSRFPYDNTAPMPYARFIAPITSLLPLSKLMAVHAILALEEHRSDVALSDLQTISILALGAKNDPSLIGSLVAVAMNALSGGALYHGLIMHAWSDSQLASIQSLLRRHDALADYQFAMRTEAANALGSMVYFEKRKLKERAQMSVWPDGWFDQNKVQTANFILQTIPLIDPISHQAFPDKSGKLEDHFRHSMERWDKFAPWNIFYSMMAPGLSDVAIKFARSQVWIDEARIACGLERYRLAHGVYPTSLNDAANLIPNMPHDIFGGQPYHYRFNTDGTYLLYSVGWNQKDDGGQVVYKTDSFRDMDDEKGDWVWPVPK